MVSLIILKPPAAGAISGCCRSKKSPSPLYKDLNRQKGEEAKKVVVLCSSPFSR